MLTPSDGVSGGYGVPAGDPFLALDANFESSAGCAATFVAATTAVV